MKVVRIAVVQLECHPALYSGNAALLEEPFSPGSSSISLYEMGQLSFPVSDIQDYCLSEYLSWQHNRLASVLSFLESAQPAPDIIVFPEGSIPAQCLNLLSGFSNKHDSVVFAGTHTPLKTTDYQTIYHSIGVKPKTVNSLFSKNTPPVVMPIIHRRDVRMVRKNTTSIFEYDVANKPASAPHQVKSVTFQKVRGRKLHLMPFICSDAVVLHNLTPPFDVSVVSSYTPNTSAFEPFIEYHNQNQIICAFCNDGKSGGSKIQTLLDSRFPNWLRQVLPEGLPAGDSILVADVDLDSRTIEVGVTQPASAFQIVSLASITYSDDTEARDLSVLFNSLSAETDDHRSTILKEISTSPALTDLHRIRHRQLRHLSEKGISGEAWWKALSFDCVVQDSHSLQGLENKLASVCTSKLTKHVSLAVKNESVSKKFLEFLHKCQAFDHNDIQIDSQPTATTPETEIVNRDTETDWIKSRIDDKAITVIEIHGLQQIGKSTAIRKALLSSGITRHITIRLTPTSSLEFILLSILQVDPNHNTLNNGNAVDLLGTVQFDQSIRRVRVIVIERFDLLFERGSWRDPDTTAFFEKLIETCQQHQTSLILESRRGTAPITADQSTRAYKSIEGLYKTQLKHGISLFDSQLRRLDINPRDIHRNLKEQTVRRLGGHPVAIALAADTLLQESTSVLESFKGGKSKFYNRYVRKIVSSLSLSDEDIIICKLLSLCSIPVYRTTIESTCEFPANPHIKNLISLSAVEVEGDNRLQIAGILREYFDSKDLPPTIVSRFHEKAALDFFNAASESSDQIRLCVEAEYHAEIAGIQLDTSTIRALTDAKLAAAHALFDKQDYHRASKLLTSLLLMKRTNEILRLSALADMKCGQYDDAMEKAKEHFQNNPQDTYLLSTLAKAALTQHRDDIAETLIRLAIRADMEDVSILIVQGRMLLRRNQLNRAADVFAAAVRKTRVERKNCWPFFYLGRTEYRLGRLEHAIDALVAGERFFYKMEPWRRNRPWSRNVLRAIRSLLAQVYIFNRDIDAAEVTAKTLLDEFPEHPDAIRVFTAVTIEKRGIDAAHEAIEELEVAEVKSRHERCLLHLLKAQFYMGIDDPVRAKQHFQYAHRSDRTNVYIMTRLAGTLYELAEAAWMDSDDSYRAYARDCLYTVQQILLFDPHNDQASRIRTKLARTLRMEVN